MTRGVNGVKVNLFNSNRWTCTADLLQPRCDVLHVVVQLIDPSTHLGPIKWKPHRQRQQHNRFGLMPAERVREVVHPPLSPEFLNER